jgi:Na+/H+ antiporter NhaA
VPSVFTDDPTRGLVLMGVAVLALMVANSPLKPSYFAP